MSISSITQEKRSKEKKGSKIRGRTPSGDNKLKVADDIPVDSGETTNNAPVRKRKNTQVSNYSTPINGKYLYIKNCYSYLQSVTYFRQILVNLINS